ncbi:MAG: hypothetical protein ABL985_10280 [Casimicrobium sp.]
MKTDTYTKCVLTVIAFCLLCLVVRDGPLVSTAHAQSRVPAEVNIVQIAGKTISGTDVDFLNVALPVQIKK